MSSIIYVILVACWTLVSCSPAPANLQRTVIFIRAQTLPGQNLFIRGGTSETSVSCSSPAATDPCAVPIRHLVTPADTTSAYSRWSHNDDYLDWYGPELLQGDFNGEEAAGTPMMWTTDDTSHGFNVWEHGHGYSNLNRFGPHFWMVDLEVDCARTFNGWFDFKAYVSPTPGWEANINQYDQCAGTGDRKPAQTLNHMARCGQINLFYWGEDECNFFAIPPSNPPQVPQICGVRQVWDNTDSYQNGVAIVGGNPQNLGFWPWQGVLQYGSTIGGCGAVLIDQRWALTAAHCVRGTNPATLSVRFGEQNLRVTQGTEQAIPVTQIHTHHYYQTGVGVSGDFDISLLQLSQSVDLSSRVANVACMPSQHQIGDFLGHECYATGFGSTAGQGESYRLQGANVPVWDQTDCVNFWGSDSISDRQVCMGTNDRSACGGDSGGPLVCKNNARWYLVGITSWGTQTCSDGPSVYTRISEFIGWISDITQIQF